MVKPVSIVITGNNEISKLLKKASKETGNNIEKALAKIAIFLEGEVKASIAGQRDEIMRRDTSRYMRSITGITPDKYTAKIYSNVEYGVYLEEGTSKMEAGHHFRNSLNRNKQKIIDYIKKEL